MSIIKKLEGSENIKESILKACTENKNKAIVFDRETYKKIIAMYPNNIRSEKIIPIRGTNIVEYENKEGLSLFGYDSLNENLILVWRCINDNLYLLIEIVYEDKVEDINIKYHIKAILKNISIVLLKLKKKL